jgi:hypothetical protein
MASFSSDPRFLVHHSLRIKGFATVDQLGELSGLDHGLIDMYLKEMLSAELAIFREARSLWQLSPAGKQAHPLALQSDVSREGFCEAIEKHYPSFLTVNEDFKALCGDWQIRDGQPNDHADAKYDKAVVARLTKLDAQAQKICKGFATNIDRFSGYAPRLDSSRQAVARGEHKMFTGVMCGSYHDIWMELHEDLILTQGINRSTEGSF